MINKYALDDKSGLAQDYNDYLLNQILKDQFEKEYPDTYRNYKNSGDKLDGFDYPSFIGAYGSPADKAKYNHEALSSLFPYEDGMFLSDGGTPDPASRKELLSRVNKYKLKTPEEKRGRELYSKVMKLLGDKASKSSTSLSSLEDWALKNYGRIGDDLINSEKAKYLADNVTDGIYPNALRDNNLNYSNRDLIEARALQIRALRDASIAELNRRKGLK